MKSSGIFLYILLLCDQNSFGWSNMVLVWPNWFGLDHNDDVILLVKNHNLDLTNSLFWSWPYHYGQVQINLVRPKPFWTAPTKSVLVTQKDKALVFFRLIKPDFFKKKRFTSSFLLTWSKYAGPKWPWRTRQADFTS